MITIGPPDGTAVGVALWRAAHRFLEQPPYVLEDTVGLQLAREPELLRMVIDTLPNALTDDQLIESILRTEWITGELVRPFRAAVVARTRFAEDLVCELLTRGVRQYVILGAGLDSFALRHPELKSSLEVFELDDAGTQAWKRRRLDALGFSVPNLHLAPADFGTGTSWVELIRRIGFDPARAAVAALLGVTQYITFEALQATMNEAANLSPGSRFVCSFIVPSDLLDQRERETVANVAQRTAARGHPWVSRYHPEELMALARRAGFNEVRDISSEELTRLYFADRNDDFRPTRAEHLLLATA